MSNNIYGPPGVGIFENQYDTDNKGYVFIKIFDQETGDEGILSFIIQSFSIQKSERTQEVRTLADTSHLYTFGKELPRIILRGMFINSIISPEGHSRQVTINGAFSSSEALLQAWDSRMRAKTIGETGGAVQGVFFPGALIEADIPPLNRTFLGVGSGLEVSNSIEMEAMIPASFTLIIMEEVSL